MDSSHSRETRALSGKVLDPTGEATLELFRANDAYSEFLWDRLTAMSPRPVAGRVLEVGCGIGNLTRIILRSPTVQRLHALDMEPAYVEKLSKEIPDPRLRAMVGRAEALSPPEDFALEGGFDFIVSTNVLEHIEDHRSVLRSFRGSLRPGGLALILVPAHPSLFSNLDRGLSHFRRYRRHDLRQLTAEAGLLELGIRYFNPLGAAGWWLNGKVLRRRILPAGQLSLYTRYAIPLSRLLDAINPFPVGVSLLAVLGVPEQEGSRLGNPPDSPRAEW